MLTSFIKSARTIFCSPSAPPLPRLDGGPLEELVGSYQRFSRWHCRRIVEKQVGRQRGPLGLASE